jgi:hypothetical protein
MKIFFVYILLLLSLGCKAQEFDLPNMKRFDEKFFKDWEVNRQYVPIGDDKYFKKGNKRVQLLFDYKDNEVQIEESNTITPYTRWATYNLETELQIIVGQAFFSIHYGIWRFYSKIGKLEKEVNQDENYKFSIRQLIEKVKKEYHINLELKEERGYVSRFNENGKYYYHLELLPNSIYTKPTQHIMIDGQTGKDLFKIDIIYTRDGSEKDPIYESLKSLKEKNKPKTTAFHGKTYTEEALLGAVVMKILN